MMALNVLLLAAVWTQEPADKQPAVRSRPGVMVTLTGSVKLDWAYRQGPIEDTADALSAGTVNVAPSASEDFISGRARVRLDVDLRNFTGAIELETRSIDDGGRLGFARDVDNEAALFVEQAYVLLPRFLFEHLSLKLGVQDLRYSGRAGGAPFFLDVTESESAFAGSTAGATALRNAVFLDTLEPVGLLLRYDRAEFWKLDAFVMKVFDNPEGLTGGPAGDDEHVFGLVADAAVSPERLHLWLLAALFGGGGDRATAGTQPQKGSEIWTIGLGGDAFLGPDNWLQVYGEGYLQFGSYRDDSTATPAGNVDHRAHAWQLGARAVLPPVSIDVAYQNLSGDGDGTDRDSRAFVSYENVDTLLILQSNEFGLDVDTNMRGPVAVITVGAFSMGEGSGSVTLIGRVGVMEFDEPPLRPAGTRLLASGDDRIGTEIDLGARWDFSYDLTLQLTAAWLVSSDMMKELTPDRDDSATAMVFGAEFRY